MFRTIARFGVVAERSMAVAYSTLALRYASDSEQAELLITISEEERAHAYAMEIVRDGVRDEAVEPSSSLLAVLDKQAGFVAEALEITLDAQDPDNEIEPLVLRLIALEGSLAENLLPHLLPMVRADARAAIENLVSDTSGHAVRLRALL